VEAAELGVGEWGDGQADDAGDYCLELAGCGGLF
jgi:hypothetical protein